MSHRISRRTFLQQAGLASAGLMLAACAAPAPGGAPAADSGAASPSQATTTITMWGGAFLMNSNKQIWDASDYATEHPNITFETTPMPYGEYSQKMAVAISAGENEPDILLVHYPFIRDFIGKGLLVDIGEKVARDDFSADVIASVVEDGQVVGVPYEIATQVNYYREDVLTELGLTLPTTIDDWFEAGEAIKNSSGAAWTIIDPAASEGTLISNMLMLDGDVFNEAGEVVLDTDAGKGVEAAELLLRMADAGVAAMIPVETPEAFEVVKRSEVVGNLVGYAWIHRMQSALTADDEVFGKWRIGMPPELTPGGPIAVSRNGAYLLVNKLSNNPDQAWDVVNFFGQSVEGVRALADQFVIMGAYKPGLQDVIDNSEGWEIFGGQRVQAEMAAVAMREDLNLVTMHPNLGEAEAVIREALVRMYDKEVTPEQAIAESAERIRNIDK